MLKATPHKARLTAWQRIYLHIFRHLARKLLAGRQPSGVIFIQSDEKSDCVSAPPALCGIALILLPFVSLTALHLCKTKNKKLLSDLCLTNSY
jgi:hypothetical protein